MSGPGIPDLGPSSRGTHGGYRVNYVQSGPDLGYARVRPWRVPPNFAIPNSAPGIPDLGYGAGVVNQWGYGNIADIGPSIKHTAEAVGDGVAGTIRAVPSIVSIPRKVIGAVPDALRGVSIEGQRIGYELGRVPVAAGQATAGVVIGVPVGAAKGAKNEWNRGIPRADFNAPASGYQPGNVHYNVRPVSQNPSHQGAAPAQQPAQSRNITGAGKSRPSITGQNGGPPQQNAPLDMSKLPPEARAELMQAIERARASMDPQSTPTDRGQQQDTDRTPPGRTPPGAAGRSRF